MALLTQIDQATELELLRARVAELESLLGKTQAERVADEERVRSLIDHSTEAITIVDVATGLFIEANPVAEKMFGLSRHEILQRRPSDLSPPTQPNGPSDLLARERIAIALAGQPIQFDWWHRNGKGERFLTEVHLVRLRWGDQDVVRGAIIDISARKQLELSERGRSRVLEGIARGEPLQKILEALTTTIEELLPEMMCSILLLDPGQNRLRVCTAPKLPEFYSAAVDGILIGPSIGSCGAAAHSGQRVIASDLRIHPNWSNFQPVVEQAKLGACWSEPIVSFRGSVLGTFAMYYAEPTEPAAVELRAIEIASHLAALAIEHSNAQQSLRELNETLERRVVEKTKHLLEFNQKLETADELIAANQKVRQREVALAHSERLATMGQMAAEFAHELNQPLYAICNFSAATQEWLHEQAQAGKNVAEVQRWVEQIAQQSHRAGEMIRRVLQFVRKGKLNRERLDLNAVIRELALLLKFGMRNRSIQVEFELTPGLAPVEADRMLIEQVLVNLVRNAAEAMEATPPEQRRIVVRTFQAEDGMVGVAVSDQGLGLRQEHIDRLFEPYFTTKKNGSGMGLPICRSTIDAHRGRIWAANNPGGGATFQFTLPVVGRSSKRPNRTRSAT